MSKRIQGSGARRLFLVPLALVCLGAFVSPAAAQVFDGFPFKGAVFTQGLMSLGGGLTDSYNSNVGPYDPATAGSNGDIQSNGNISLSGGVVVHGDATAHGTVSGGTVTGVRTSNAPSFSTPPTPACPAGGYTPAQYVPSGPGIQYNATTGALTVQGGGNLTLTAPPKVYHFSSVNITGGSTITVNGGGNQVQIWVDGSLTLSGGGVLNTAAKAPLLGWWACGSNTSQWTISGGSNAYFSVYAPLHPLNLSAGAIFGAVVGASVTATNFKFHFDEALVQVILPGYGVVVAPHADTVSRLPGTNYTKSFTVQNVGNATDSYDLLTSARPGTAVTITSITGTGVTQGSNPDSARLASVVANATVTVTVHYNVGSGAVGPSDTLLFEARSVASPSSIDNGRLTVTILGHGVVVTPHADSVKHLPSNGTNYTASFIVQNTGNTLDNFDLLTKKRPGTALTTVSITGSGVTQGSNPDSARLANLAGSATAAVTVTYTVGNVAAGTIDTLIFTARSVSTPASSDSGKLVLTVVRPSLTMGKAVSPNGSLAPGTVLSYTLSVTNGGTSNASGVALVDTLAAAVQFKLGSVTTTLPTGVTALVQYAKVGDTTWTYVPTSAACSAPAGYDRCVNRIRWALQNPLSYIAPDNKGTLQFVAQIR